MNPGEINRGHMNRRQLKNKKRLLLALGALVIALFVSGAVWRAFNPRVSENPDDEGTQLLIRQDGYYLCLDHPKLSLAAAYRTLQRKYPNADELAIAERGCQEAHP
jgi:hypothetical protein